MDKPAVAVLFGGRSSEHSISSATAGGVLRAINRDQYRVIPVGITRGGVFVLDRFGRVPVLRAAAGLAVVGLLLVILSPVPWLAIVGTVLWGIGASLGFPVGMSAAADDPRTAAATVSAVATIGYCAFLVGPPVIGLLGQRFDGCRVLRLHTDAGMLGTVREGALIFRDELLIAANRRGLTLVGLGWDALDRVRFEEIFALQMRAAATEAGRDPMAIEVTSGGARTVEATKWYTDLGVHRLLIKARSIEPEKLRDELTRFGDEVIANT